MGRLAHPALREVARPVHLRRPSAGRPARHPPTGRPTTEHRFLSATPILDHASDWCIVNGFIAGARILEHEPNRDSCDASKVRFQYLVDDERPLGCIAGQRRRKDVHGSIRVRAVGQRPATAIQRRMCADHAPYTFDAIELNREPHTASGRSVRRLAARRASSSGSASIPTSRAPPPRRHASVLPASETRAPCDDERCDD